jgi:hypothetical protein
MGLYANAIAAANSLTGFIRAPYSKRYPGGSGLASNRANATSLGPDRIGIFDNTYQELWANAAGTDVVSGCSVDALDNFLLSGEQYVPMYQHLKFNLSTAASLVSQQFAIVPTAARLVGITEIHATAESTAATMTAYIEKLTGTTAPGSGLTVQSGTFNMKSTANTLQSATLYSSTSGDSSDPRVQFAAGDRIGIKFSTAGTELAGVVVTLTFAPNDGSKWVVYNMQANGDLADQSFFLANRPYIVQSAYEVHSTLGTNGSAVSLQITKDTTTGAPGGGTDLLTNNTNAGFNLKAAINTVQTGTLTATAASLRLLPGDRLSVDYAGTLTAVAGVVVVVSLQATERRKEVTFTLLKNGNLADQAFFTADRNYKIEVITEVHSVAGTDGSAVTLQVTVDKATEAPGAGVDLLSNNSSAGFDMKGTANTVQVGTFVDTRYNYLMAGDRLAVDFAGTLTTLAGVTVTVSLLPA